MDILFQLTNNEIWFLPEETYDIDDETSFVHYEDAEDLFQYLNEHPTDTRLDTQNIRLEFTNNIFVPHYSSPHSVLTFSGSNWTLLEAQIVQLGVGEPSCVGDERFFFNNPYVYKNDSNWIKLN